MEPTPVPPSQPRRGSRLPNIPRPRLRRGDGSGSSAIDPLIKKVRSYNPRADTKEIQRAFAFAESSHEGQKRMSGEDFITHPVAVAEILADLRLDTTTLEAALLHDTVEDTLATVKTIEDDFGEEVARIVDGLTKLDRFEFRTREQEQAENVRKMIVAMAGDIRVLLIKLADRLHNMRTLGVFPEGKQRRIATETMEIYAPLAHRLGVQELKWELEDLSFKALHPGPYREIASLVDARRGERTELIEQVTTQARAKLKELGVKAEVEGRPKHLYAIYEKMVIRGKEFNEIYDLVGVRILVESLRDTYAALGAVHSLVEAHPRQVQGLRRHAQGQHVPIAAHDGRRARRQAAGDPDPHPRDAPNRQVRHRRPLALQGRRQEREGRRRGCLAGPDDGLAEGHGRPARVHGLAQDRPVRRAGLRVHAEGRCGEPARRRHAGRLRLRHPHRCRSPHDRREGGRQAGAAGLRAADGRLGGGAHLSCAG